MRQRGQQNIQNSVPVVIGSDQGGGNFQQLHQNFGYESPIEPNNAFSFHEVSSPNNNLDPVPFNEVFPDESSDVLGMENYLSNLDLSNT
jgi:hypothetical protein